MKKNLAAEKEKNDFLRGKSNEKYNSVLHKKKDLDQNYDAKMKELAKRIKMKELNGSRMSPDALKMRA